MDPPGGDPRAEHRDYVTIEDLMSEQAAAIARSLRRDEELADQATSEEG